MRTVHGSQGVPEAGLRALLRLTQPVDPMQPVIAIHAGQIELKGDRGAQHRDGLDKLGVPRG